MPQPRYVASATLYFGSNETPGDHPQAGPVPVLHRRRLPRLESTKAHTLRVKAEEATDLDGRKAPTRLVVPCKAGGHQGGGFKACLFLTRNVGTHLTLYRFGLAVSMEATKRAEEPVRLRRPKHASDALCKGVDVILPRPCGGFATRNVRVLSASIVDVFSPRRPPQISVPPRTLGHHAAA